MQSQSRPLSLAAAILPQASRQPGSLAVTISDRTNSYGGLLKSARERARQMLALGVGSGDRVGILLPNCLEYLEIILGASLIGAVAVPINMRFKSRELLHLISDSGMSILYSCSRVEGVVDFSSLLAETLPGLANSNERANLSLAQAPRLKSIVAVGTPGPFMLLPEEIGPAVDSLPSTLPDPELPLLLMYTSGTTANPKGCIVSHRAFVSNAWAIIDWFGLSDEDLWWCPLPMFHIGGLLFVVTMLVAGGRYGGMTHFDPDQAVTMIAKDCPTIFYPLFPTITLPIINHSGFAAIDKSAMRIACNLAPTDLQQMIQSTLPHAPLVGAFGMTETCGTVCYGLPGDPQSARFETCGRPLPGWEVRIVDQLTREPCAPGIRGEIAVRGPGLFSGYWNEPELTAAQHITDGWFLTGDVGSLDEEGFLSFHGRYKDQLKVGGENVSALEVESYLATHPAVALAQVIGMADAKYGEVPAAFIELKPGAEATEDEIIAWCKGKIARFKEPRVVRFVKEWPMSATKIMKFRLREQLEQDLESR